MRNTACNKLSLCDYPLAIDAILSNDHTSIESLNNQGFVSEKFRNMFMEEVLRHPTRLSIEKLGSLDPVIYSRLYPLTLQILSADPQPSHFTHVFHEKNFSVALKEDAFRLFIQKAQAEASTLTAFDTAKTYFFHSLFSYRRDLLEKYEWQKVEQVDNVLLSYRVQPKGYEEDLRDLVAREI